MKEIKFIKTKNVTTPQRGTTLSAGLDIFTPNTMPTVSVLPNESVLIEMGLKVKIPKDTVLIAMNKSSIALQGFDIGACVIDADYQGEIKIHLINTTHKVLSISPNQAIAQLLLIPIHYPELIHCVDENDLYKEETTERGEKGFGQVTSKYIQ